MSNLGASALKGVRHTLFDRTWAITIDTLKITDLDISFKITKSIKPEPNKCELHIWNLTEAQRAHIEEIEPKVTTQVSGLAKKKAKIAARKQATVGIPCKVEAGYNGEMSLLWLGDMRDGHSEMEGPDWVTEIGSGDGEKAWQNARLHVSYGPKTPVDIALRAMVDALGIGKGNIEHAVQLLKAKKLTYPQGTVIAGPVSRELTDFCRSADLEWSIQDGALQFLDRGAALANTAVHISSDTGMLGSPTVDIDGILKVKVLLTPDVRPGRLLLVDSRRVHGGYKAEKCIYTGDSNGTDWTIDIEARRYSE